MGISSILLIAIVFVGLLFFFSYNNLIGKKNQIDNAAGGLDATLKQRFDLIPELVEVTKQYMKHEETMFTKIIELRSRGKTTANLDEKNHISDELNNEIGKLLVTVENYPELASNQNFLRLQDSMIDLEKNIAAARRFYNAAIIDFNDSIQMIPGIFIAPIMGLKARERYSIDEFEKNVPNTKDLFSKK